MKFSSQDNILVFVENRYFKSFDGAKIFYSLSKRSDSWLIFVHGMGGDETAWDKERDYFSKLGFSTLAFDLRGHGFSGRSQKPGFYQMVNFAQDLKSLIDHLKIKRACIIGHCFGGMVAMIFASKYSGLLKSLILVDTSYKPPFISNRYLDKKILSLMLEILSKNLPDFHVRGHVNFNSFAGTTDLDWNRLKSDILHTSLRSYLSICKNLINFDGRALLTGIKVPTLVVEGEKDTIFPPEIASYIAGRIRGTELDLIPNANHIIVINNPGELSESIEKFLRKINFLGK